MLQRHRQHLPRQGRLDELPVQEAPVHHMAVHEHPGLNLELAGIMQSQYIAMISLISKSQTKLQPQLQTQSRTAASSRISCHWAKQLTWQHEWNKGLHALHCLCTGQSTSCLGPALTHSTEMPSSCIRSMSCFAWPMQPGTDTLHQQPGDQE